MNDHPSFRAATDAVLTITLNPSLDLSMSVEQFVPDHSKRGTRSSASGSGDGDSGHGCLMVQRPGEHYAVWHFWDGPDREFVCWYLNLQTAFVRTADGYETQDLELDLVVFADGAHIVKDEEVLDVRVSEGRYSPELVAWIRQYGQMLIQRLETEGPWWDLSWAEWEPDPAWRNPAFPDG